MAQRAGFERTEGILNAVKEGMKVVDVDNDNVGTVEFVHLGAVGGIEEETGTGPATATGLQSDASIDDDSSKNWVEAIADVFSGEDEDINDDVQERLYRSGFIRVDGAGLFADDRYIVPDQIAAVTDDVVHLKVNRDALIEED